VQLENSIIFKPFFTADGGELQVNIKDLKIRNKLFAAFSLIISLMILIGYLSYQGLDSIKTTLNTIFSVNMPSLDYLIEADRDLQQLLVAERSMISMESNSQGYSSQEEDYNKNLKQMYERFGKFKALINYPEATALIEKFEQDRSTWEPISHEVVEKSRSTDPAVKKAALELSLHKSAEAFETMRDSIDKLTEIVLNHATTDHQNSDSTFKQALTMLLTIIAVASIAAGIIVWSLNITITRPIKQAVAGLKDIAKGEGDLTQRLAIRSNDEIGEMAKWINSFMEKLQGIKIGRAHV
jgi:methyl-accepting chemotaxis protein